MNYIEFDRKDIDDMTHVFRLNLVNSVSGYKAANLIGSVSDDNILNVAIFSSVIHLGSNPPTLGFIVRPTTVPRNTLENIRNNGSYTINHIHSNMIERSHYTSAKFEREVSEFEACNLTPEFVEGYSAPFVKESRVKIAMKFLEEIPIKHNGTIMIIGEIERIILKKTALADNGIIDLNNVDSVAISGLNKYHRVVEVEEFPYARIHELPKFLS